MVKQKKKDKNLSIDELQERCEDYLNGWRRAQADYRNLEHEMEKKRAEWVKMANADLIMEVLPIYDNLKLALKHIPEKHRKSDWVIGVEHIKNQFAKFLEDNGVEEIKTQGEEFNSDIHEAVKNHDAESNQRGTGNNIIKKEVKAGYKLNGKVLYAAKVIV